MLAADKLQLQSALKQQATALKEKEFNLHHSNLMTVGTQAAVLAGLDITMFIEFSPAPDKEWGQNEVIGRFLKMVYYGVIVAAFCANMIVVSHTTTLSVLGAGLALRGPDGSMMTATDGLFEERSSVFRVFGIGLALTVGSILISVWLMLDWEAAFVSWAVASATCHQIFVNYQRVFRRFNYDESQTVDFRDIFEGPAAIRGVPLFSKLHGARPKAGTTAVAAGNDWLSQAPSSGPPLQRRVERRGFKKASSALSGFRMPLRNSNDRLDRVSVASDSSVDYLHSSADPEGDTEFIDGSVYGNNNTGISQIDIEMQPLIAESASSPSTSHQTVARKREVAKRRTGMLKRHEQQQQQQQRNQQQLSSQPHIDPIQTI